MCPCPKPTRSQDAGGKLSVASPPPAQTAVVSQEQTPIPSQNVLPMSSAMPVRTQALQPRTLSCPEIAEGPLARRVQSSPSERLTPYVPGKTIGTSRRISTVKRAIAPSSGAKPLNRTNLPSQETRAKSNADPENGAGSSLNPFRPASRPVVPAAQKPEKSAGKILPRPIVPASFNPNPFVAQVPRKTTSSSPEAAGSRPATTKSVGGRATSAALPLATTASMQPSTALPSTINAPVEQQELYTVTKPSPPKGTSSLPKGKEAAVSATLETHR